MNDFLQNGVVAHRGAHNHGRGEKNSLSSFRDAIRKKFAFFECDVLFSKDENVVVTHGPYSGSDGGIPDKLIIAETNYCDLKKVYLENGDYIPLLSEVIDLVMTQNCTRLVIEIKNTDITINDTTYEDKNCKLAQAVLNLVQEKGAQDRVIYISFVYTILLELLKLDASVKCAPLDDKVYDKNEIQQYKLDGMWGVDFNSSYFESEQDVTNLHNAGLTVNVWTVNELAKLVQYHDWGIDFITTDEPEKLLAIRDDVICGVYHLTYKATLGIIAINKINPDGFGTVELWRGSIDKNICIVETIILSGQPYLFIYRSNDGKVSIYRIAKNGRGITLVWTSRWSSGWTSVQFFKQNGKVYHHSYKKGDGTVAINMVNQHGNGTTEIWRSKWTPNWSCFRFFNYSNGNVYHISYKLIDGTVAMNQVNTSAVGTTEVWRHRWTKDWSDFGMYYIGTQPHQFIYKTNEGVCHFDLFQPNGQGTENIANLKWTKNWTDFQFFKLNERWHHLSLKESDGTVAINEVNALGKGSTEIWRSKWTSGWTHIRVFCIEEKEVYMGHSAQGTSGWTKLKGYQALWDPKIDLGKFYFTTFEGNRQETPYMTAENFARVIDILRNETPVYGNASTGSVTTQGEEIGEEES